MPKPEPAVSACCSTKKMGNKTLRYGDGGWVFMRAVMDQQLHTLLEENFAVKGFRHTKKWQEVRALTPGPKPGFSAWGVSSSGDVATA